MSTLCKSSHPACAAKLNPRYPLSFAPMVGLTHTALRALVADMGGCGIYYTEMLAARRLPSESIKHSNYIKTTESEKPLLYQLFLAEPEHVDAAVAKVHALGGDGIDINLGCPAPSVRKFGAGAGLGVDHKRVQEIIARTRKMTDLHLSVKIRLGNLGEDDKLLPFCQMLEGEGVEMIAIHARYHGDKFCRHPKWQMIAPISRALSIPVYANGGIFSVSDAKTCLERSEAAGLMLGRGGAQKPWLFNDIAREIYGADLPEPERDLAKIYFSFVARAQENFEGKALLVRVKLFTQYMAMNHSFGHHLATSVQRSDTIDGILEIAYKFFGIKTTEEA